MAWIFSPQQVSAPRMESFRSRGFVFKSTEMIDLNQSEFKLAFSEINCENGTIECEIIMTPFLNKSSEYSSAFFLLQIPYHASNIDVIFLTKNPEYFGGNTSIQIIDNLTYVMFNISKEDNFVEYNLRGKPIFYNFMIESPFNQLDWYTFELPITWGGSLHNASKELDYLEQYDFYYSLHIFGTQRSFLNVEKSQEYYYSTALPTFDQIGVWRNFTSYYWDLKSISPRGSESSIILELTNLETKNKIDLRYSVVWFLLGIGIPLSFSSAIEIIKNQDLFKEIEFRKKLGIWVIAGLITLTFLFIFLIHYLL